MAVLGPCGSQHSQTMCTSGSITLLQPGAHCLTACTHAWCTKQRSAWVRYTLPDEYRLQSTEDFSSVWRTGCFVRTGLRVGQPLGPRARVSNAGFPTPAASCGPAAAPRTARKQSVEQEHPSGRGQPGSDLSALREENASLRQVRCLAPQGELVLRCTPFPFALTQSKNCLLSDPQAVREHLNVLSEEARRAVLQQHAELCAQALGVEAIPSLGSEILPEVVNPPKAWHDAACELEQNPNTNVTCRRCLRLPMKRAWSCHG